MLNLALPRARRIFCEPENIRRKSDSIDSHDLGAYGEVTAPMWLAHEPARAHSPVSSLIQLLPPTKRR